MRFIEFLFAISIFIFVLNIGIFVIWKKKKNLEEINSCEDLSSISLFYYSFWVWNFHLFHIWKKKVSYFYSNIIIIFFLLIFNENSIHSLSDIWIHVLWWEIISKTLFFTIFLIFCQFFSYFLQFFQKFHDFLSNFNLFFIFSLITGENINNCKKLQ